MGRGLAALVVAAAAAGTAGASWPWRDVEVPAGRVRREGVPARFVLGPTYVHALEDAVRGARRRVLVATYYMRAPREDGYTPLGRAFAALEAAKDRGVEVEVWLDQTMAAYEEDVNVEAQEYLSRKGIAVRVFPADRMVHAKAVIVDGETVLVGSHNWTSQGVMGNREAGVLFADSALARALEAYLAHAWDAAPTARGGEARARVNLNAASVRDLAALPEIGPEIARRIVEERERGGPFRNVQEVEARVAGIGPKRVRAIAGRVTFR